MQIVSFCCGATDSLYVVLAMHIAAAAACYILVFDRAVMLLQCMQFVPMPTAAF